MPKAPKIIGKIISSMISHPTKIITKAKPFFLRKAFSFSLEKLLSLLDILVLSQLIISFFGGGGGNRTHVQSISNFKSFTGIVCFSKQTKYQIRFNPLKKAKAFFWFCSSWTPGEEQPGIKQLVLNRNLRRLQLSGSN